MDVIAVAESTEKGDPTQPTGPTGKRLLAALLSALVPGAGQILLGNRRKAALLIVILAAVSSTFWGLRLSRSYWGLVSQLWMCLLLSLYAVCDALFTRDKRTATRLSRWWFPIALVLVYISVNFIFTPLLLSSGFRALRFASSSMAPTLNSGERFIYDTRYYDTHVKRRGDLVVLRNREGFLTVKRIIAVAGDKIVGKNRTIFVNDESQNEPYVQHEYPSGSNPDLDTFGPINVATGHYFVMGDNRDISLDSRAPEFGLLNEKSVVGKPLYSYRFRGRPKSTTLN